MGTKHIESEENSKELKSNEFEIDHQETACKKNEKEVSNSKPNPGFSWVTQISLDLSENKAKIDDKNDGTQLIGSQDIQGTNEQSKNMSNKEIDETEEKN